MTPLQKKDSQKGVIFFSVFLVLQIAMQVYNLSHGKSLDVEMILATFFVIVVCRYYYPLQSYLKNKGLG